MRSGGYNRILLFSEGKDFFRREIKSKNIIKVGFKDSFRFLYPKKSIE